MRVLIQMRVKSPARVSVLGSASASSDSGECEVTGTCGCIKEC